MGKPCSTPLSQGAPGWQVWGSGSRLSVEPSEVLWHCLGTLRYTGRWQCGGGAWREIPGQALSVKNPSRTVILGWVCVSGHIQI